VLLAFDIGSEVFDARLFSFGMFWEILWALILGFALSGAVQAVRCTIHPGRTGAAQPERR
jgi:hypothetical protein